MSDPTKCEGWPCMNPRCIQETGDMRALASSLAGALRGLLECSDPMPGGGIEAFVAARAALAEYEAATAKERSLSPDTRVRPVGTVTENQHGDAKD